MSVNVATDALNAAPQLPFLIVGACHTRTGNRAYAQLTQIDLVGTVASLIFRPIDPTVPIPTELTDKLKIDVNRDVIETSCYASNAVALLPKSNVKQVLINVYAPTSFPKGDIGPPTSQWTGIISQIGKICQIMFPNMNPAESSYNAHFQFCEATCDSRLLPNFSWSILDIKPKFH